MQHFHFRSVYQTSSSSTQVVLSFKKVGDPWFTAS